MVFSVLYSKSSNEKEQLGKFMHFEENTLVILYILKMNIYTLLKVLLLIIDWYKKLIKLLFKEFSFIL